LRCKCHEGVEYIGADQDAHQMSAVHDRQRSDILAAKLCAASPIGAPLVTSSTMI
jgi:hypothetical protein